MKVKICGITNIEDALAAIEFGADALGFNFYPKSSRYLSPEKALRMMEDIPPSVWRVGVFVNEPEQWVRDLSQSLYLDFLQFHGDETPEYCEQFATPYWKAFRLKDEKSLEEMGTYHPDYFLIDAHVESIGEVLYGGTGVTGDWDLARESRKHGKVFLSGGLTPDNVETAIQTVQPDGVDVASGVESEPGKKDWKKMESFISKAKGI